MILNLRMVTLLQTSNGWDYVLFSRQPLCKMSMMGHRVKVMAGNMN